MKYCSNCGHEVQEDANFCRYCGQDLRKDEPAVQHAEAVRPAMESEAVQEPAETAASAEIQPDYSKSPSSTRTFYSSLSNRTKTLILIGVAALILFFVGYKIMGPEKYSPEQAVERFNEALEKDDSAALADLLFTKNKELKITEAHVQKLISYLNENPGEKRRILSNMQEQVKDFSRYKNKSYAPSGTYQALSLTEESGKGYRFEVTPVYFEVSTTYKGTEIYADDEKVATSDQDQFKKKIGPYMPGEYQFRAVYKTDLVNLESEKDKANMSSEFEQHVDLELSGKTAKIRKPFSKGVDKLEVYLNGKKANIDLLKQENVEPIEIDGSVKVALEADFPWGKMRSQERPIESSYNDIPFIVDQKLQKQLQEAVVLAEKERLKTMTSFGAQKPKTMHPDLADALVTEAKDMKSPDWTYKAKYLGSDFDKDSFTLKNGMDDWEIEVIAKNYIEEARVYKGDNTDRTRKKDESSKYIFTYDMGVKKWVLTDITYGYLSNESNVIEYREKDSKAD